jgi:hypothetical protein
LAAYSTSALWLSLEMTLMTELRVSGESQLASGPPQPLSKSKPGSHKSALRSRKCFIGMLCDRLFWLIMPENSFDREMFPSAPGTAEKRGTLRSCIAKQHRAPGK